MRKIHTAAALADGTAMADLHGLSRAQLQSLADAFYRAHLLCEMAAGERRPFPAVIRSYEPDPAPASQPR